MKYAEPPPRSLSIGRSDQAGVALVVILLAVAVITGLVVFFFLSVSLQRQLSLSSAGQANAEILARTAVETVVGDLRDEIISGSKSPTTTNLIYLPLSRSNAVPSRVADQGYPNVLKKSASLATFWPSPTAPARAASDNPTDRPSLDGRYIDKDRWNRPYLLSATPSLPDTFVAPDWIVITRQGAITNATAIPSMSLLSDDSASNRDYAIGRFAYIVYDEGGLIDINVAGRPTGMSAAFGSKRGLLPQMALDAVPGVTDGEAFVKWRNLASAATATTYENSVYASTNGFAKVLPGDQKLINRQDLITYVTNHPDQISAAALPFLGTFSREVNSPSYAPRVILPPGTINDAFNPNLAELLGANGGALKRFPLTRLGILTRSTTTSAETTLFFGLTRASSTLPWTYKHDTANKILKISEVPLTGPSARNPDFFELLQAAIAQGSLGKTSGNSHASVDAQDQLTDGQIIQIGVNIIDQYNSSPYPTRVIFNGTIYSGTKNLPYLSRVSRFVYRPQAGEAGWGNPAGFTRPWVGTWLVPEVWNPFARPAGVTSEGPAQLRFVVTGSLSTYVETQDHGNIPPSTYEKVFTNPASNPNIGIKFAPSASFGQPMVLTGLPSVGATAAQADDNIGGPNQLRGIFVVSLFAPDKKVEANGYDVSNTNFTPKPSLSYLLQYLSPENTWVTYDQIRSVTGVTAFGPNAENSNFLNAGGYFWDSRSDPTADRFGCMLQTSNSTPPADLPLSHATIRPGTDAGVVMSSSYTGVGWGGGSDQPGLLSDNQSLYTDPDGVQRKADGAYATSGNLAGFPMATSNTASRPIMLNRPFRSVAELGYASRGMPWKHLDFFTENSADAALLDVFSVNDDPEVIAGRINPNTRSQQALAAVISGGSYTDIDSTTISQTEAATLAQQIIDITSNPNKGPLLNRSELATLISPNITYNDPANDRIKTRREALVRSLADVSNTRTWNLMIDVIVQGGSYPKKATDLNQFRVNGTRRYWVHIAIDRYTNKVIDQVWEPVYE